MLITFKFISNKIRYCTVYLATRTTDLVEDAKQHRHCLS